MMTNTLRDRIAKVLSDTLLAPISMCDAEVLAEAVIAALGLRQETTYAWNNNRTRATGHRYVTKWTTHE
jgi:hypothetical protein